MENRHIGKEVKALSNLIKRAIDSSEEMRQSGQYTGTHGYILGYLYDRRDRDVFARDIEAAFSIRRPTATGILELMEKNGLIEKRPVSYDARLKKLVLTDRAVRLHESVMAEFARVEERLRSGLTDAEVERFFRTLDVMKQNMES